MTPEKSWWTAAIALGAAFCFLLYSAMQYNLAAVTASLSAQPVTVVIDAGHGGEDGGAVSAAGTLESGINLAVSLRLEQLLALCGIRTVLIRSEDVSVSTDGSTVSERKASDLRRRAEIVNQTIQPVLVSIHQNHFSDPKYDGAQVFYSRTEGSRELAGLVQQLLREALDSDNRREVKRAQSVYLLEHIHCPAILVECGFLSNPEEAARLETHTYQKRIACALACGLVQYLEEGNDVEV